jgi:hypothetical protein
MAKDSHGLNTNNLTTADKRIKLGALLQLVLHTLAARTRNPRANLVLLQPVAVLVAAYAFVDDCALAEAAAAVAAGGDVAEGVDLEGWVPVVERCGHGGGGGEREGVGEDVGGERCCGVGGL